MFYLFLILLPFGRKGIQELNIQKSFEEISTMSRNKFKAIVKTKIEILHIAILEQYSN